MPDGRKPVLGITMGDPAGIGPEIIVKALAHEDIYSWCKPYVIGSADVLDRAMGILGMPKLDVEKSVINEASFSPGTISVCDFAMTELPGLGRVSAKGGDAAFLYIKKGIDLALVNSIDAVVTSPINKEALKLAGHDFAGHTEIFSSFSSAKSSCMLLVHGNLYTAHVSTHIPLREACGRVKKERVLEVMKLLNSAMMAFGVSAPRIGVAGLNPHAGENGLFGTEEIEEIAPAIAIAQSMGILAEGPISPDIVFSKAIGGFYDAVVAMYHDQGHIPLKINGFVYDKEGKMSALSGVNITLGLPIIRTSVDHGTAFDLAGKGTASEQSLLEAMKFAAKMASSKMP
ncbi:MAG: 4-hydroxythreonine-4-phosphate dehydrogenase PdxA [Clostridiales bacterium]|nr:4-hydroxythreonine-4-phosphate dehydrogenase PdxA [Clostridiales bacterium]